MTAFKLSHFGLSSAACDEDFKINLKALQQPLKKSQVYAIKNGRLYKKNIGNLFCKIIYYLFQQRRNERRVNETITQFVKNFKVNNPELKEKQRKNLRLFFFERMASLNLKIFDRGSLRKCLIPVLSPELAKTEEALTPQQQLERKVDKVRLALKLGVPMLPIRKGSSGSYLARDRKYKIMGVFKPASKESLGGKSPKFGTKLKNLIRKIFKINPITSIRPREGYISEVSMSYLSQHLKFSTVPLSKVVHLRTLCEKKGKDVVEVGSFQLFLPNTEPGKKAFKIRLGCIPLVSKFLTKIDFCFHRKRVLRMVSPFEFQQMAALDFISNNADRHFDNILVEKQNRSPVRRMHLIDNQLAFPWRNPPKGDFFYKLHQFEWELLPQAKNPFSPKMKRHLEEYLTGQHFENLVKGIKAIYQSEGKEFDGVVKGSSQEIALRERVAVLLKFLKTNRPIRELAKLKTESDLKAYLTT